MPNNFAGLLEPETKTEGAKTQDAKDNAFSGLVKPDSETTGNAFAGLVKPESKSNDFSGLVKPELKTNSFKDIVAQPKPQGNMLIDLVKGISAGTEQAIGQSIGSPMIALGETLKSEGQKDMIEGGKNVGKPAASEFMIKSGEKIISVGTKIRDFFIQNSMKGFEAPDPKIMTAEFGKSGYGQRLSYSLGSSIPMMVTAVGVTATTKNPLLGASIFGPQAFGSFYDNARANGVDVDNAIALSLTNAVSQVGLESIPMGGWLKKGGGLFKRIARGAIQEGLVEEGSQQVVQNALEGIGWKGKDVNLLDGVVESVIVGTIMGAGMGAVPSSQTVEDLKVQTKKKINNDILLSAKEQGLTPEQVKPIIESINKQIDGIENGKIEELSAKVQHEVTKDATNEITDNIARNEQGIPLEINAPEAQGEAIVPVSEGEVLPIIDKEAPIPQLPELMPGNKDLVYRGMSFDEFQKGGLGQHKSIAPDEALNFAKLNAQGAYGNKSGKGVFAVYEKGEITKAYLVDSKGNISAISTPTGEEKVDINPYEIPSQKVGVAGSVYAPNTAMNGNNQFLAQVDQTTPSGGKVLLDFKYFDNSKDAGEWIKNHNGESSKEAQQKWVDYGNKLESIAKDKNRKGVIDITTEKSHISEIKDLVSKYDNGDNEISTVEDVVDGVDEILSELNKNGESGRVEDKIIKAIDKFRKEQEYDNKLSGRGDMDTARDNVMSAIEKYTKLSTLQGLSPQQQSSFLASKQKLPLDRSETIQEQQPTPTSPEQFKLYDKVEKLIQKYAQRFGEQYTPKGTAGAYFKDTGNIFLQSVNSVSTAVHEVSHFLDNKLGISAKATRTTGTSKSGNPIYDHATLPMRKALTAIYTKYYPGGQADHKLSIRVKEGMAVLFERYAFYPEATREEFPELVNAFFGGGEYYNVEATNLIRDVRRDIIEPYQKLDALSKVGAKVTSSDRPVVKSKFMNWKEKAIKEFIDNLYPLEKIGREAGAQWSKNDPSLYARLYNSVNSILLNNVIGNKGYWALGPDLSFVKLFDYNWKTLTNLLKDGKATDTFAWWLVARREKFEYDRLDKLVQEAESAIQSYKDGIMSQRDMQEAVKKFKALQSVLSNDGFDRRVVETAYQDHLQRFTKEAAMFDSMVRADLDMAKVSGLVAPEMYSQLTSTMGYAPFHRDFKNEILGEETDVYAPRVGKTKVSSLMARSGSEATIDNPVHSAILNHAEVVKKALRQVVYNKVYGLIPKINTLYMPDQPIFQILPLDVRVSPDGRISYPQEKDPNIMMARINGKRIPVLVDKTVKLCLDECLTPANINIFEQILATSSRWFVKGTTGLYPAFTITNFMVDQVTASAQTETRLKPIYSPIKELVIRMANSKSPEAQLFLEYLILGGERQTLTNWMDKSANDLFSAMNNEKKGIEHVLALIDQGFSIFSLPAKYSEIVTRGAEYVRSRLAGEHQIVALEHAGRVTAPFHHGGRWGGSRYIRALPFFNASLEVLAQYSRTWKSPKTRARAAVVLAALTAGIVGSLGYMLTNGTDEQKRRYKNLSSTDLANYIWLPFPDGKRLMNFKIPEQMATFGALINMAIADKFLNAKYSKQEYVTTATSWIPDQLDPTSPVRMFFSWLPQIIMPTLSVATNLRFWPQVRPLEGQRLQGLPPEERYTESTSIMAKKLGAALKLSPIKIDALIEGYLGRAVKFLTIKNPGMPIVREMYFNSTRNLQYYYDLKEKNAMDYRMRDKLPSDKLSSVISTHNKLATIDRLLDTYRKLEISEKQDSFYIHVRNQILDAIDTLRGELQ